MLKEEGFINRVYRYTFTCSSPLIQISPTHSYKGLTFESCALFLPGEHSWSLKPLIFGSGGCAYYFMWSYFSHNVDGLSCTNRTADPQQQSHGHGSHKAPVNLLPYEEIEI